jgi:TRAP transporter 4TM/12TM fusion protein
MEKSFDSVLSKIVAVIAVTFSIFTITIPLFPMNALALRSIHLAFIFSLAFLGEFILKEKERNFIKTALYSLLLIVALVACIYLYKESQPLQLMRMGMNNRTDLAMGLIVFVMVLICTKKYYGWLITGVIVSFVLYMLYGQYLPRVIGHPGLSVTRMISNITLGTEGIFGSPLGASSGTVAIFIVFASFLEVSSGFGLFMDLAMALFGKVTGGSAKVSVVASTLFGMISGSAAACTAAVGTITIPAMKQDGYEAHVAGAIQAAAGSGGQLMPPIMGAAAFVMAELLGKSYSAIMFAGVVPALCYYMSIFMSVHLYSHKRGIRGSKTLSGDATDQRKRILRKSLLLFPIPALFFFIAVLKMSPGKAALYSTGLTFLSALPYKDARFNLKKLFEALYKGGIGVVTISVICAASGIIIGVFTVTGLGLKLSSALIMLSGGKLSVLLVLSMVASLILGMGVPTVAAYLILAILVAPALVQFGVLPIAAHMFVFYFGIISAITPPVALAAYVGSGLAKAPPVKVGVSACVFALPSFVVPYILVYSPALMLQSDSIVAIIQVVLTTMLGCFLCAATTQRYIFKELTLIQTVLLGIGTICVMIPETITDYIGLAISIAVIGPLYLQRRKEKRSASV